MSEDYHVRHWVPNSSDPQKYVARFVEPAPLQVWFENELVGHLPAIYGVNGSYVRIEEIAELTPDLDDVEAWLKTVVPQSTVRWDFLIVSRNASINHIHLHTSAGSEAVVMAEFFRKYNVPSGAVGQNNPDRDETTFSWRVVEVDEPRALAVLFDLKDFDPA